GKPGWTVQGLDLTLLVDTHHDRVLGWIQIEPYDVFQFLGEALVLADLEALQKMRLQPMGVPDAAHRCLADTHFGGHCPGAPMSGIGRFGLRRLTHHLRLQSRRNGRLAARSRRIFGQAVQAQAQESLAPSSRLLVRNPQGGGAFQIGPPAAANSTTLARSTWRAGSERESA